MKLLSPWHLVFYFIAWASNTSAIAKQEIPLETIQVTGAVVDTTLIRSPAELEEQLADVAGGTNFITFSKNQQLSSLTDALSAQPGIIVQEFFGGMDQPRLNIRGSGLQGNPVSRGVLIRENHLPINEADGSFIIGTLDLANSEAAIIHRGANSQTPGSLTLGGDINFLTQSHLDNRDSVKLVTGSFSQQQIQLNHERSNERFYYQLGYSEGNSDGYRHHSTSENSILRFSAGTEITENLTTEFHWRQSSLEFDMPFVLTRERAENNPTSVYGDGREIFDIGLNIYARDPHRATNQQRISNQFRSTHQSFDHMLGLYWQYTDDSFVDPMSHINTDSTLVGWQYTFDHYPTLFLHYQLGIDANNSQMQRDYFGNHPLSGTTLGNYANFDLDARNTTLSLITDIIVFPEWTLTSQLQYAMSERNGDKDRDDSSLALSWQHWLPKIGILFRPSNHDFRLFSNISRSVEIPTFWELIGTELNPIFTHLSEANFLPLKPQVSTTFELGGEFTLGETRGHYRDNLESDTKLDIALYRSHIQSELISTASQYGVIANSTNYEKKTVHQGIELGVKGRHPLQIADIHYNLAWTYSDFYFVDSTFEGNQIAGIPKHIINGGLLLQYDKFSLGPTLTWSPVKSPVDHSNSLDQESYMLIGFKLSIQFDTKLGSYFSFNNITDKTYNSSYVVRDKSSEDLPTFLPGNGFSFQAGITLSLDQ